jgi:hypothetical protein
MSNQVIWYFIKFFEEERYADEFIAGKLYLNRLSYFRKLESRDDGRPDTHEAVAMWWQPQGMRVTFANFPELEITDKDLAGPISIAFDFHDNLHIYCLYSVQTPSDLLKDGKIDCTADQAMELQKQLVIDDRCLRFGKFAVIISAVPFLDRLKLALGRYRYRAKSVEYYDDEMFHGEIKREDIPFNKQKRFKYQREFRISINTGTKGNSPLRVDIGSIKHITAKIDSSRLNALLELKLEPVA